MSTPDDECVHIKIKEKQPTEWSHMNQAVVKFSASDGKEEVVTPESEKSPMISPTRPSCLKAPWSGNQAFSTTSSPFKAEEQLEQTNKGRKTDSRMSSSEGMKKFFLGDDPSPDQSDLELDVPNQEFQGGPVPTILISNDAGETMEKKKKNARKKPECLHVSLPDVTLKSNPEVDKSRLFSEMVPVNGNFVQKTEKSSFEEDQRTLINLISNLQNIVDTLSVKCAKLDSTKSNKQLNFRSHDDIINTGTQELMSNEFREPNKEYEALHRPETKRSDDFSFYFRNKSRTETPDCELFLETERLLDGKTNGVPNIRWSDANSVTSPCSTVPESPFERKPKNWNTMDDLKISEGKSHLTTGLEETFQDRPKSVLCFSWCTRRSLKWTLTSLSSMTNSKAPTGKKSRSQNIIFPRRSVLKNGECNVLKKSSNSKRRVRYLQDIFTTLVDVKWRWTLVVFALSFIMSWLFYAGVYWLIAYAHGDFEHLEDEKWTPCVENLVNFASCFLFSVETQHTIGYGGRATTEECPEAIFVMCIQSITGVMISAFMAGIFFAKMARPKQRRQTLLFSRKAVICRRDAQMCLMFRVGDMRKSHIIGTNIRAHLFRSRTTREGEDLPQYQCELQVFADGCESNIFFIWPLTIVHVINKDSPLYTMSAQDLLQENFEVVAILEGTVESTGQTTQARTSYLPNEIKWGHRFESLLSYNVDRQCYEIDYKNFNNTVKVATPLCSAKDLEELYVIQSEMCDYNLMTTDPDTDNQ